MFQSKKWHDKLPDVNEELNEEYLHLFFETLYERQLIWKKRFIDKLERPWTDNEILRDNKFTNVYRELDRSSQWEIKNILMDKGLNLENLVWKILVYRTFNNPQTFEAGMKIGYRNGIPNYEDYDKDEFYYFIEGVRNELGMNPFTSSYFIHPGIGHNREYNYSLKTIPELHALVLTLIETAKTAKKPEEIIALLNKVTYVSDFVSHEYYQDFTYIARYTDKTFMRFDQNDFTNVGPGVRVGVRLIFPSTKPKNAIGRITDLRDIAELYLNQISEERGEPMPYLYWNGKEYYVSDKFNLTLHQIEMWLCEFSKYWKMMIGEGKQRSKFIPKGKTALL